MNVLKGPRICFQIFRPGLRIDLPVLDLHVHLPSKYPFFVND